MDDRYGCDDDDDSVHVKYMAWHCIWFSRERKIDRQTNRQRDICEFTYGYEYRYWISIHIVSITRLHNFYYNDITLHIILY